MHILERILTNASTTPCQAAATYRGRLFDTTYCLFKEVSLFLELLASRRRPIDKTGKEGCLDFTMLFEQPLLPSPAI